MSLLRPALLAVLALAACRNADPDKPGIPDADGDGYDELVDCDDENEAVHPDADEVCDGLDNDCDGTFDLDVVDGDTFYTDGDGDGYGDPDAPVVACERVNGLVENATDCDDTREDVHPSADESDCTDPTDYNCDGSVSYADEDGDGYAACEDCDDTDRAVHPSAVEVCDDVDNDCDGDIDGGAIDAETWYADVDDDGYGDPDASAEACDPAEGYVANATDCDDTDATLNPDTLWHADGDGDGYGSASSAVLSCEPPAGFVADATDCDDADADVFPGAPEPDCTDPTDYDCDGTTAYADVDGDGAAACEDCDDTAPPVHPGATEVCDGVDNNCDGSEDGAVDAPTWYADVDGDGYGDPALGVTACTSPPSYVVDGSDCDDTAGTVHPGADEHCDGVDEDCDRVADDSPVDPTTWYADADGDGYAGGALTLDACSAPAGYLATADDCDDLDPALSPETVWYHDGDHDGYGDPADTLTTCAAPAGYLLDASDCDDTDPALSPETLWYADADADGYGDAASPTAACLTPAGYVADATDCDDAAPTAHQGAVEDCDGLDNDCDGVADEPHLVEDFDDPVDPAVVSLNGTAVQGFDYVAREGWLQLTDASTDQAGAAFLTAPVGSSSWYAAFSINISGGSEGDGLALAFLNSSDPTVVGRTGGGFGFKDLDGYAVALDTYNAADRWLLVDGLAGTEHTAPGNDAVDPVWNTGWRDVEVWFDAGDVTVMVDDAHPVRWQLDPATQPWAAAQLLGVTAGTGSATQQHLVDDLFLGCAPDQDFDYDGFDKHEDCDNVDPTVYPGAPDAWGDGVDQDCDGIDGADADGDGNASVASGGTDCDDADAAISYGTSTCPAASCADIAATVEGAVDGIYTLDSAALGPVDMACDLSGGGWMLVFKKSTGVTNDPYDLWVSGDLNATDTTLMDRDGESADFASPWYKQHWADVAEVRVEVLEGGEPVQWMEYAPAGADDLSWYDQAHLTGSSYTDLVSAEQNYWSITGDASNNRHWFINGHYGGCAADTGWVVANGGSGPCTWNTLWAVRYAQGTTAQSWTSGSIGTADALAVWVR